jgi:hypothetical protein
LLSVQWQICHVHIYSGREKAQQYLKLYSGRWNGKTWATGKVIQAAVLNIWTLTFYCFRLIDVLNIFWDFRVSNHCWAFQVYFDFQNFHLTTRLQWPHCYTILPGVTSLQILIVLFQVRFGYLQVDSCILEDGMVYVQSPGSCHVKYCIFLLFNENIF